MYAQGKPEVAISEDGWTIATRDGKISGLFEDTVAATIAGPEVLTRLKEKNKSPKFRTKESKTKLIT